MTDNTTTLFVPVLVSYLALATALWYFAARWWYRD